jgi:hypothetical protein
MNEAGIKNLKPRTVGKYLRQANRHVFPARWKPWLRMENRNIRKRWRRGRWKWGSEDFRKHVYTDEIKLQVGAGIDLRKKVGRQPRPESAYENKNVQPTFVGEPLNVGFWAAIFYGHHTPLITPRK